MKERPFMKGKVPISFGAALALSVCKWNREDELNLSDLFACPRSKKGRFCHNLVQTGGAESSRKKMFTQRIGGIIMKGRNGGHGPT